MENILYHIQLDLDFKLDNCSMIKLKAVSNQNGVFLYSPDLDLLKNIINLITVEKRLEFFLNSHDFKNETDCNEIEFILSDIKKITNIINR